MNTEKQRLLRGFNVLVLAIREKAAGSRLSLKKLAEQYSESFNVTEIDIADAAKLFNLVELEKLYGS